MGSTKLSVVDDYNSAIDNKNIIFLPSHPIAGLEKSGPEFGLAKLFENRFCIITPLIKDDLRINPIIEMWKSIGMKIEIMDAKKHDRVLAMTSHIPQLIAFSVVTSATELENQMKNDIIKYSAAGFRDFTRLAGSDPIMWRDIYSMNKEAVLEMLKMIRDDNSNYEKYIQKAKDKNSTFRLMGFGHRVYKNYDPRAKIIKVAADKVLQQLNINDPLLDIAKELENAALNDEYFISKKLYPNVDFYSGIIYRYM